jgi:hypothetical protein
MHNQIIRHIAFGLIATLLTFAEAHAGLIHRVASSAPPTGNCPYAVDNGCAASTTYASSPASQDTAFAYNSSQSGQLPPSPTIAQIAARNLLLHCISWSSGICVTTQNDAYLDYPIGSNAPSGLVPISAFGGDSVCAPVQVGGAQSPGTNIPYVYCQGSPTSVSEALINYDFTNNGTASVLLIVKNPTSGSGVTYTLNNLNFQAGSFSGYGGNGLAYSTWTGTSGAASQMILFSNAGTGPPPPLATINNLTCDGNFANAPTAAAGRLTCINDNRQGPGGKPYKWPIAIQYSVFRNLGHNPILGTQGGDVTIKWSLDYNNCLSGATLCHKEFFEYTGIGTNNVADSRNYVLTGNVTEVVSNNTLGSALSASWYLTAGSASNINITAVLSNNLSIVNYVNCANSPTAGAPLDKAYSPNNPCTPQSVSTNGNSLFSIDYDSSATLTLNANIIDSMGAAALAANGHNEYLGQSPTQTVSASSSGNVFSVTTPTANFTNPSSGYIYGFAFWPGQLLNDSTAGWSTTISSFGTYSNDGTINNTSGCLPGSNAGCGTINLSSSEPTSLSTDIWWTFAGIPSLSDGGNNYSIGGVLSSSAFTGSITSGLLTVSVIGSGPLIVGQQIGGAGIGSGCYVYTQQSGTAGSTGKYLTSGTCAPVGSEAMTGTPGQARQIVWPQINPWNVAGSSIGSLNAP